MTNIDVRKYRTLLRSVKILSILHILDINDYFDQISLPHFASEESTVAIFQYILHINRLQRRVDAKIFIVISEALTLKAVIAFSHPNALIIFKRTLLVNGMLTSTSSKASVMFNENKCRNLILCRKSFYLH